MVESVGVEVLQDVLRGVRVLDSLVVGELLNTDSCSGLAQCNESEVSYRGGVGVVPVELVAHDVLPAVVRLLPAELDVGAAHLHRQEAAGLAGHALLGLDLDRGGEGPGADGGVGLHPDGVDGVGREVADGGELVVVHKLGIPLRQWLVRRRRVVHLRQRQYGENDNDPEYW